MAADKVSMPITCTTRKEMPLAFEKVATVQAKLIAGTATYLTKIGTEKGKYKVGEIYSTSWRDVITILSVQTLTAIKSNPNYAALTSAQRTAITKAGPYEVLRIKKSATDVAFTIRRRRD